MIALDKPCELTVWRMVAILAYSLEAVFTHADALTHKNTIRTCLNELVRVRPRGVDLPRIIQYADSPHELDMTIVRFAYGTSLPESVVIHAAVALHVGSVRGYAGGDGSAAVVGRAVLASADSELRSLTIGVQPHGMGSALALGSADPRARHDIAAQVQGEEAL